MESYEPRAPWSKGKLAGQKAPLKPKDIGAIRIHLQNANQLRDLALFNPAIDSKLRGCTHPKAMLRIYGSSIYYFCSWTSSRLSLPAERSARSIAYVCIWRSKNSLGPDICGMVRSACNRAVSVVFK